MPVLTQEQIQQYLQSVVGIPVAVLDVTALGKTREKGDVKQYGYGIPLKVDFQVDGRERQSAVLHTVAPGPFGHEHMADRAQQLLWEHQAFNRLPRHVRSLDVCGCGPSGHLRSLGGLEEFCLLTDYAEGESYSHDMERMRDSGVITSLDLARADALCDYLVEIHKVRGTVPGLYVRRIRELVGHGECIMGIVDAYPAHPLVSAELLEQIEHLCVKWRWRLKNFTHRLRQVHGDFHPWNILFREGAEFSVLDRSRGEFGDAADDVTSLVMNYLFFSLQRSGRLEGAFETLFNRFWRRYVERSGDREISGVAAPFLVFRGLVMASPLWYPALPDVVRQKLINFVLAVLGADRFEPEKVNEYCGA